MACSNGSKPCSALLRLLLILGLSLSLLTYTVAQPATLQFEDCFSGDNSSVKLEVSNVYAQFFGNGPNGPYINFTVLGQTPLAIEPSSNGDNPVATTLFTTTEILTFQQWVNNSNSFFCSTLRPPSPLPAMNSDGNFCPIPAGPFAFSTSIQLLSGYELLTYDTRLRALDPFQNELLCLDLNTTTLKPGAVDSVYGHAHAIFWATVGLAIGYWLVVGLARLVSAWGRGSTRSGSGLWSRVESAGFILASALSGERFASSPALMRFCTPSLRDVMFHTQWCAALSMVAVQWPAFAYPLLSQTAWATLSYNISITQGTDASQDHWNPLTVEPYQPPSNFADQLNDSSSAIFVNATAPNVLFQLPLNATPGIQSFAWSVGLRPQDLFGVCLSLFLAIIAATIVISVLIWAIHCLASMLSGAVSSSGSALAGTRSPRYSSASKDMLDAATGMQSPEESRSLNGHFLFRTTSRFPTSRPWWRLRTTFVSFHGSVLQGNLMSLGRAHASLASIILAALSFAILSVLIPIFLILRLTFTNTTKLYDETWTLLSLGPLYNHYRHGSQLFASMLFAVNVAFGVVIGCGQKSGTVQAIIILVIEVVSALGTSIWLPWGQGASMGLISFLFCVARIVIAVLLVILTPVVSIGSGAAQWVAYAILFILGLVYLAFCLMLLVKIVEGMLRIFGGIGFNRSRHVVDSGLLGTLGLMGCCGSRRPHRRSDRAHYSATDMQKQPSSVMLSRPNPAFRDGTPPSNPPSVLRPEHALQPYKEESDDETGYIMGAWQPFPGPGYNPVAERAPSPEQPKSGFSRVAGGRAHYDSPYAIASGSTQTFPSVERNMPSASLARTVSPADYSPPPTPSISSAPRRADLSLPPGAMPPAHIRTKSQTAIIEDASALVALAAVPRLGSNTTMDPPGPPEAAGDDPFTAQPKKKHWYMRRKSRRMSEGDLLGSSPLAQDAGRSFVVVRKQRPGAPSTSRDALAPSDVDAEGEQKRSFTVLRQSNSDTPTPS